MSTDRQDLGPEAQRAAITAWAASNEVKIVEWFLDKGISGASELEDRPELIAALAALKARGAGVFVVAKRDRLARDTLIAQLVEKAVNKIGGEVVSADGLGNGHDPASKMLRSILDAVAEYERAAIRSRVKAALRVKAGRGERVGAVPYGYSLAEDGVHLVPVHEEQEVIQLSRALRSDGSNRSRGTSMCSMPHSILHNLTRKHAAAFHALMDVHTGHPWSEIGETTELSSSKEHLSNSRKRLKSVIAS